MAATGLLPTTAPRCLQPCFRLEPDWLAKAAALKLPHKGRATSAAFGRQAALRIVFIAGTGKQQTERQGETRAGKRKPIF